MNRLIREIDQVIKLNLRQLVVLKVLYRLVAGTFYIRLVNQPLRFSLRMAGYSYLTMSNMGAFLWRPATIVCGALVLAVGMVLLVIEIGGPITVYQVSAYSRKIDPLAILRGTLGETRDEYNKRSWELLPLALAKCLTVNSYLLARLLIRIKPLNFTMYEISHGPATRPGLVPVVVGPILVGTPAMLVFFTCMTEQKGFRDGFRRSLELLKGRWPGVVVLLLALNLLPILFLLVLHFVTVVVSVVVVSLFMDGCATMVVLAAVYSRLEIVVLLIGSLPVSVVDFGVLAVVYYQFEMKNNHRLPWGSSLPRQMYTKRKWMFTITGALAGASLFLVFDVMYNGSSPGWSVLGRTKVAAHRGGSRRTPENTMVALEEVMDEMAGYSEIDVQISADEVVVVRHDLDLERVTGVDRRLGTVTLSQLEELDVGSHLSKEYTGEKIPTLREMLEACKGRMELNIELKSIEDSTGLSEQVAAMVMEFDMEEQCVIISVKPSHSRRVKEFNLDLRTSYILVAAYGKYYGSDDFDFISIRSSFVNRRLVEAVYEDGKAVHVWTANSKTELEQMKFLGVDNIITDDPVCARETLFRKKATETVMEYLKMMIR